jgi:hypothetical protein
MASAAKVELDIFSGRENPSWSLDEDSAAQLAALVRALPRAAVRRTPFDGLGYRGFVVAPAPASRQAFRVHGDAVWTNGDELRDPERQVEKFLWSSMPPNLRREFKDLVPGSP